MSAQAGRGLPHLAAAIGGRGSGDPVAPADLAALAGLAERGMLDFVTLGDAFGDSLGDTFGGSGLGAGPGPGSGALSVLSVLAGLAPRTRRIGLVPTLTAAQADPLRLPETAAALDRVSGGRAGWVLEVPGGRPEAGPARLPRPPRGGPVAVVDVTDPHVRALAAAHADVALVGAATPESAEAVREELRERAAAHGRDPEALRVLAALAVDLGGGEGAARPDHGGGGPRGGRGQGRPLYRGGPVDLAELIGCWHRVGAVDGFHITPVEPHRDLERFVNGTVALLQHRGLFRTFYPGGTLREHLGLERHAAVVRHRVVGGSV
ncbi:LLM class flavin-dependent oxidoreductase [Streptomyces tsukubensis]|uniref:Luciferase-like domain-containing protein n=1 Tax=Streptomyces tsukubensis TaxID=83656 RepID=A0A1V4AFN1_9ACTN|nr:LLM class flavin-dependent oxidoreductase [Streptomyces tsukubensis]OON82357.1 hypothetical protein B1H18_04905 [Streptomyces tsukubensis]QFR92852.1 LLM class flavin-dependent oxidoreductase [Streptomyces tsukubensis]